MTTNTYILSNTKSGEQRIIRANGKGKALKYARGQIVAFKATVDEVLELIDKGVPIEVVGESPKEGRLVDKRQIDFINEGAIAKAGAQ
jgi:hypothetical protein